MRITCTVNGEQQQADDVWEGESLLYVLRERLGFPGSKNACEQGECGSCTVYLDGVLACSCLVAAGQAQGRDVRTVEGLASGDELSGIQQAFLEAGAVQCGFCTPGLLVAAHDLIERQAEPSDAEIREALAGNLCRCTGYEKIMEAVRLAAARRAHGELTMDTTIVLNGCAVVTVDGARTEHDSGHVIVEGGADQRRRRRARPPRPPRRPVRRRHRVPGHARPGEHPPSPLPVGDRAAWRWTPPCSAGSPSCTRCGAASTPRSCSRRPGAAWPGWPPPAAPPPPITTTSSRATAGTCSRPRSARRARSGCASTRPGARWTWGRATAACRRTTWSRTSTGSWPPPRPPSTPTTIRRPSPWCGSAWRRARRSP